MLDGGAELNEEPWSLTSGLSSADWRIVRQHEVQPYHDEADYTVTRGVEDTVESLLQLTSKYEIPTCVFYKYCPAHSLSRGVPGSSSFKTTGLCWSTSFKVNTK